MHSRMRILNPVLILLFTGLSLLPEPAICGEGDGSEELRRFITGRAEVLGIQTTFPSESVSRRESSYAASGGTGGSAPGVSSEAAQSMLWCAVAVFIAVLVLSLRQQQRQRSQDSQAKLRGMPGDPDGIRQRMGEFRDESDALAARGDYAGAMHCLLLKSVEEMRRRLGVPIHQSLTSREILARTGLGREASACLGDIVKRVEISWFGAHRPDADDYTQCRNSFSTLADILERGGRV